MASRTLAKESAERVAEDKLQAIVAHKRRELELAQAEVNARIEVLQREMAVKSGELDLFLVSEASRREAGRPGTRCIVAPAQWRRSKAVLAP